MTYHSNTSFFPLKKGDLFEMIQFPIWWDVVDENDEETRIYPGDILLVMEEPYEPTEYYKNLYNSFPEYGRVAKALVLNRNIEILLLTVKEGRLNNLKLISETKCET